VTWIGGGGQDPAKLQRLGVPELRNLFREVFGQVTASNNSNWLRKKLAEPPAPDAEGGARRAAHPRSRDMTASIWTAGSDLAVGGEAGVAREMMRPPRADPCLLEAQQFILRGKQPAIAAKEAPAVPAAPAAPAFRVAPVAAGSQAANLRWGAKRVRSAMARPEPPASAVSPPVLQRLDSAAGTTLQMESAPTSDNEHDARARAAAPSAGNGLLDAAGAGARAPFLDDLSHDDLLKFPWDHAGGVLW
jgi:hypothetical protein